MTLLSYNTQDLLRTAHASDTRKQVAHQKLYASARSVRPSARSSCLGETDCRSAAILIVGTVGFVVADYISWSAFSGGATAKVGKDHAGWAAFPEPYGRSSV
jgi:hypothetical protein